MSGSEFHGKMIRTKVRLFLESTGLFSALSRPEIIRAQSNNEHPCDGKQPADAPPGEVSS